MGEEVMDDAEPDERGAWPLEDENQESDGDEVSVEQAADRGVCWKLSTGDGGACAACIVVGNGFATELQRAGSRTTAALVAEGQMSRFISVKVEGVGVQKRHRVIAADLRVSFYIVRGRRGPRQRLGSARESVRVIVC